MDCYGYVVVAFRNSCRPWDHLTTSFAVEIMASGVEPVKVWLSAAIGSRCGRMRLSGYTENVNWFWLGGGYNC